uniref:AraC family transcriptional regulator ligand-binding domain-containing protein n=1 Tax=Roseihalotalea indica TaxID=2867963 RepID=A0AA49JB09_9BACT|nr:AraC family transcriptional regulator ligand-binding domain-containing protein [Tunicatimonas sp. TK19036]
MSFVSSSIYQKATRLTMQEGLSPALLDHHRGRKEIIAGDKYIPMELLLEVYELADQHMEAGFGVRQGQQLTADDYGTLGLSWKTCWRAKDVLDRVERYMVLVTDHGQARIEERQGITSIYLMREARRKGLETANEATFVMLTGVLKEITHQEIHPVTVHFQHHTPEAAPFVNFFQCPVHFGQAENSLYFKTSDIDIPTVKADKSIHQFLVERMDEEKKGIHANADRLLGEIHKIIAESLPSGIPSIIQVAEYLGMSARTLKRRLAEKGLTFRDLIQTIQQDVSIDLLKNSSQSMGEIAFQTGFSEQSAFNRAFRRWTGQSPADYRKNS